MKKQKQNSKLKQNKMSYKLFLMFLFIFSFCFTNAQPITINLPSGDISTGFTGGTMVYDIIYANGKMFVYSSDKILVYNATTHEYSGEIPLGQYGKFNPIYFNPRLHVNDINIMTVNNNGLDEILYAITPNLHILAINTDNISGTWDITPYVDETQTLEDLFQKQNGRVIIKYDNNNNRLFLLVSGKNLDPTINCTGNFHYRTSFFGIYDIDNNYQPNHDDYINLYYSEINDDDDPYTDQINDFVFNTEPGNFYYITRLGENDGIIEAWEITPNGSNEVELIERIVIPNPDPSTNYYKLGKMLYINNNGLHKIIVFPYRYPDASLSDPKFCVIDGNHTNSPPIQHDIIDSPSKRILDALFLTGSNDLLLSYAPDNEEIPDSDNYGTDIAVFNYNGSIFVPSTPFTFSTDNSINTSDDYDINSSFKLLKVNSNTALVSKKDEIVKLHYNGMEYTFNQKLSGENNFFMNSVIAGGKSFIINTVANGIEVFDYDNNNNYIHLESIRTGYPVYHITANTDGSKLYFYNKLNAYNTGLYIYGDGSLVNINDQQSNPEHEIETSIGDCIYNTYTDQFLVSENADFGPVGLSAKIKVFNTDQNNSWNSTILLTNTQYAKRMFIAPNEKLYVMTNMRNDPTVEPKVFIYDANDYSLIQTFNITNLPNNDDEFEFYSAHFCYNHYNQKVYATIHPTEINLDPYNTVPNSMFEYPDPNQGTNNIGFLIKFDDNQITTDQLEYPGKIICPDIGNPEITSQYDSKMFIIGKKFYVYNNLTDALDPTVGFAQSYNDITYSPEHDMLFAFEDIKDPFEYCPVNNNMDRMIRIDKIFYEDNNINFEEIAHYDGQASSIFSNPYDGKVYIYNKIDDEKLGDTQVRLLNFDYDPGAQNQNINYIDLGVTSFYPELDHNNDYHYYFYNITTPYIDPYDTAIYLPNGGHSCISKVFFETNEALLLNNGEWAWLSFPRLNRSQGDPTVHEVLYGVNGEKIDPSDYEYGSELENLPPNGDLIKYNIFDEGIWQPSGDLSDIQSTLGYKLKLDYDPQYYGDKWLHLKGNVLDPETSIQLYTEKDNWVGYFLYQEQDVFDALADVIDDIYMIKAQDWTCVYTIPCARNANNQGGCWIWDNEVHNVKYGDMLILNTYSNFSFQWNYSGNLSNDEPRAAPEYYSYEEKADYTPMIIELDTVDNLLEIGAFINDSCIGANTVLTDDSIVMLRAYMDGQPGDSVTFEKYFGSSKAYNPPIHEYFVNNIQTGTWEKRTIKTGEKQDYYLISFKTGKITNETESNPVSISCAPNPFKNKVTIKFTVQQECMLQIGVYDLYGKPLNILQEGVSKAGTYHINWTGTDSNGKPLPNGVYILKLKAGTNYAQTKIVIVK